MTILYIYAKKIREKICETLFAYLATAFRTPLRPFILTYFFLLSQKILNANFGLCDTNHCRVKVTFPLQI